MTAEQMSRSVEDFFEDANRLQWKKNKDYHPDNVAFLEILQTAFDCGMTVEQDLWAKVRKQFIALRGYMIDGHLESEGPISRMTDVAVYMGMIAFWTKNKPTILADAERFVDMHTNCERPQVDADTPLPIRCERCRFLNWLRHHAR